MGEEGGLYPFGRISPEKNPPPFMLSITALCLLLARADVVPTVPAGLSGILVILIET